MQSISKTYMKKLITLPEKMETDIAVLGKEFGFANESEFVRAAVRDKILELKKLLFMQISSKLAKKLKEKGLTEKEIVEDFLKRRAA